MRRLRTASLPRLLAVVAALVAVVAGAGIAQAALTGASKPAPKALDQAVLDALNAPPVQGVSARIEFTNSLLPSGSLPQGTASPTLTGATGRLWLADDGRARLELQSSNGDAQIVSDGKRFLVYDAASKTALTGALPQSEKKADAGRPRERATLAGVQAGLAELGRAWTLSGATPGVTGNRPSYTVRIAPKDDGGLLGAAELAWDAARGVPLRAAVYAQGTQAPVLELEATDVAYGPIPAAKVDATPPAGARVTELNPAVGADAHGAPIRVQGVEAVGKAVDFPLSAPDELAGLPRTSASLIKMGDETGALVTYGKGFGALFVFEKASDGTGGGGAGALGGGGRDGLTLPQVNIDGATGSELSTALGTVLTFDTGGVSHVLVGSVPPLVAENAARDLR
jgi:outer membrane lipoprotein-sorting protein